MVELKYNAEEKRWEYSGQHAVISRKQSISSEKNENVVKHLNINFKDEVFITLPGKEKTQKSIKALDIYYNTIAGSYTYFLTSVMANGIVNQVVCECYDSLGEEILPDKSLLNDKPELQQMIVANYLRRATIQFTQNNQTITSKVEFSSAYINENNVREYDNIKGNILNHLASGLIVKYQVERVDKKLRFTMLPAGKQTILSKFLQASTVYDKTGFTKVVFYENDNGGYNFELYSNNSENYILINEKGENIERPEDITF